jgi:hypothetical protein
MESVANTLEKKERKGKDADRWVRDVSAKKERRGARVWPGLRGRIAGPRVERGAGLRARSREAFSFFYF